MENTDPAESRSTQSTGRFAYDGLHRVIHEKARLGIMTSLIVHADGLLFADLKELCSLTDGNLNRHLHVLQEAQLVEVSKGVHRRRSQTMCRITAQGRARFIEYVAALEKVVADAAAGAEAAKAPSHRIVKGLSPA